MKISATEFEQRLKKKQLRVALIGMSNIGKSTRARQLHEESDFELLSVDTEIEKQLGLAGIEEVARWMGFPHEKGYPKAEKEYLEAEERAMREAKLPKRKNFVLDTTGSVIYLAPAVLEAIKENFLVVHLAVDQAMVQEMTEKFFVRPKPVIWGGMFDQRPKESLEVAYRRCYYNWLKFRLMKYHDLADLWISGRLSTDPKFSVGQFLKAIEEKLVVTPSEQSEDSKEKKG